MSAATLGLCAADHSFQGLGQLPKCQCKVITEARLERPADWPEGGVLYKAPKAGQERRVDLPAIGPETMVQAARAGLAGVAILYGEAVALDLPDVIAEADRLGLFLWVCEAEL